MLPSLADRCTEFLREKVDASNVFHVLPDAQKYEEKDLEDHCWEVIDKQANDAVKSDGFVTIGKPVLEALVERESLNVMEVELFKAVDCWASKECEKQGLTAEGSVKRRILGERIVKAIRFPVMEQKEFADVVLDRDILTKEESFDMVKYFNSVLKVPVGFTESTRPGSRYRLTRFEPARMGKGWGYSSGSDFLVVSVSKSIKLYSVRLFGSENNEYSVTLKVTYSNGVVLATKTGTFMSELIQSEGGDYHGFDIVFEPPVIILEANLKYCFEALINGPPSWYGNGCPSRLEHSCGVTFCYNNRTATRTTWQKGQFSEFEFTLH